MKKILIADDDENVRGVLLGALAKENYAIGMTNSVASTRTWCELDVVDVLLIDDLRGGGVALGDELHLRYKRGESKMAVIITSAGVKSQTDAPQIQKGKPGFLDELRAKVAELAGE